MSIFIFLISIRLSFASQEIVLNTGLKTNLSSQDWNILQDQTHFGEKTTVFLNMKTQNKFYYAKVISPHKGSARNQNLLKSVCDENAKKLNSIATTYKKFKYCLIRLKEDELLLKVQPINSKYNNIIAIHQFYLPQTNAAESIQIKELISKMEIPK